MDGIESGETHEQQQPAEAQCQDKTTVEGDGARCPGTLLRGFIHTRLNGLGPAPEMRGLLFPWYRAGVQPTLQDASTGARRFDSRVPIDASGNHISRWRW